jgi:hypothetical protein
MKKRDRKSGKKAEAMEAAFKVSAGVASVALATTVGEHRQRDQHRQARHAAVCPDPQRDRIEVEKATSRSLSDRFSHASISPFSVPTTRAARGG